MAPLAQAPPASPQYTPSTATPSAPDDRSGGRLSGRAHRQLIGVLGLALPTLVVVIAWIRPNDEATRWQIQDSISAYYYTSAIAAFVGLLVALALFLLTYQGYANKYQWADRAAAVTAGLAALGVAFFPTAAPNDGLKLPWWTETARVLHYVFAGVLFTMFAVFSLWLFRLTTPGSQPAADKEWRNRFYTLCGMVIVASMVWAGVAGAKGGPIFAPESLALAFFAASWLVKGEAPAVIAEKLRKIRR
jgi:succinate dehydrogenase/fumarate reductase cytochrome b subunit